jgi:hypothetical protein
MYVICTIFSWPLGENKINEKGKKKKRMDSKFFTLGPVCGYYGAIGIMII